MSKGGNRQPRGDGRRSEANLPEAMELYLEEFPLAETAPRRLLTTLEITSA
jgi:hypothetical protein